MTTLLRRRGYLSLLAALLLAFGLAACGGDDDNGDDAGNGEDPTATEETGDAAEDEATNDADAVETEEPADDANDEEPADSGDDADEDPLEDLQERAAQSGPERFKFVYDMTVDGETFTLTFARDGDRNMYAIDGTFEGQDSNIVLINDGETSYVCSEEGEGEGACFEQPGTGAGDFFGEAFTFDRDEMLQEVTEQGAEVSSAGSREVAGRSADCYDFTSDEGSGTMCLDQEESFIVYTEGEFEGVSQRMELVEATDPSDSDFEPPYESMGSIGG